MTSTTAIGALILVPIVIAGSAAYIALKTTEFYERIREFCQKFGSPWRAAERRSQRRLRRNQSHLKPGQLYADSWCDLDSNRTGSAQSTFIGQSRKQSHADEELGLEETVWHPTRSARLLWSFSSPRSRSRNLYELSNVARPLPVAQVPERV